ncbi:unnamed protein product [Peniophora sp. CBMAI 1063]|nr:unnamed protein product [Peniophora sp. CBMAI 1063]
MRFRFQPLPISGVEKRVIDVIEAEKVKVTSGGRAALLRLSEGDMRRALNALQPTLPADIETVVNATLADEFLTACSMFNALEVERGLALQ